MAITEYYAKKNNVEVSPYPPEEDLAKIHKDFNDMPKTVIQYKERLDQVLSNKIAAIVLIIEEMNKALLAAKKIKDSQKGTVLLESDLSL